MISVGPLFKLATSTLWTNKLRSFLTLLGMLFGTAAVIATLSSNEGASRYLAAQLESLGNNVLIVFSQDRSLISADRSVLERHVPELKMTSLEYSVPDQFITHFGAGGLRGVAVRVVGIEGAYFDIHKLELQRGRRFLPLDDEMDSLSCILGASAAKALFGDSSAIGRAVFGNFGHFRAIFNIVGVLKEKGGPAGAAHDYGVFMPISSAQKIFPEKSKSTLVMGLHDDNLSTHATAKTRMILGPKYGPTLSVSDSREAIERTRGIWAKQNQVGLILAGVSLLTGGVGIMNIMLLSIAQRRKEIGLRKAVGAQNVELAVQFLLEAVIICLVGGVLGIVVGWGFGQQVAKMMGQWEAVTSLKAVALALGFSAATGVFFGLFPAIRASKIDPYDALRSS